MPVDAAHAALAQGIDEVQDEVTARLDMARPCLQSLVGQRGASGTARQWRNYGLHADLGCGVEALPRTATEMRRRFRGGQARQHEHQDEQDGGKRRITVPACPFNIDNDVSERLDQLTSEVLTTQTKIDYEKQGEKPDDTGTTKVDKKDVPAKDGTQGEKPDDTDITKDSRTKSTTGKIVSKVVMPTNAVKQARKQLVFPEFSATLQAKTKS